MRSFALLFSLILGICTFVFGVELPSQWVARYNGTGNGTDEARAVAVDSSGNIYVTGRSRGSGTDSDYATVKYSTDGNQLWEARYNGPGIVGDAAYALAVDSLDNVYVTGGSAGNGTGGDYATIKYTEQVCLSPIAGDINGDCKVDFEDFAVVASHWLECTCFLEDDCW